MLRGVGYAPRARTPLTPGVNFSCFVLSRTTPLLRLIMNCKMRWKG